jgi:hypothetical protein
VRILGSTDYTAVIANVFCVKKSQCLCSYANANGFVTVLMGMIHCQASRTHLGLLREVEGGLTDVSYKTKTDDSEDFNLGVALVWVRERRELNMLNWICRQAASEATSQCLHA